MSQDVERKRELETLPSSSNWDWAPQRSRRADAGKNSHPSLLCVLFARVPSAGSRVRGVFRREGSSGATIICKGFPLILVCPLLFKRTGSSSLLENPWEARQP